MLTQCNHEALKEGGRKARSREGDVNTGAEVRITVATNQLISASFRSWEKQGIDPLIDLPEGTQPC